eukprot:3443958-Pyramimonas_sp.AAC.1
MAAQKQNCTRAKEKKRKATGRKWRRRTPRMRRRTTRSTRGYITASCMYPHNEETYDAEMCTV